MAHAHVLENQRDAGDGHFRAVRRAGAPSVHEQQLRSSGNTDIYVHDLSIDNTSGRRRARHIHALGFHLTSRAGVCNHHDHIGFGTSMLMDDGLSFMLERTYYVRNNKIYGTINAWYRPVGRRHRFRCFGECLRRP